MITDDYAVCPSCGYSRALTHYSSDTTVNWVACPKCRSFFEHDVLVEEKSEEFWKNVEKDVGFKLDENGYVVRVKVVNNLVVCRCGSCGGSLCKDDRIRIRVDDGLILCVGCCVKHGYVEVVGLNRVKAVRKK
jgi:hypothetical protein